MEEADQIEPLKSENQALKTRLKLVETELALRKRAKSRFLKLLVRTMAGRPLYGSVSRLVDELTEHRIERDTIKNVVYATLHRLTRVGMVTLLVALGPLVLAILQTYYLKKQNEKFDVQNKRIEQQTYLQEAERRSSLVFLFDNVLDKLDEELKESPGRELSPQLVGRIIALSKALKPYRFLEGDSITPTMSSPERGQLLLSLVASKLGRNTYDNIFLMADFSYAILDNVSLDDAYLRNINLSHATLKGLSLVGADFSYANLESATFMDTRAFSSDPRSKRTRFDFANFHAARLENSDFTRSSFVYVNFTDAVLQNVLFRKTFLNKAKFDLAQGDTLDFSLSVAQNTRFSLPANATRIIHVLFSGTEIDSFTFSQVNTLPLLYRPVLDTLQPKVRISRDTFFVNEKTKPVVVEDTIVFYRIKRPD